MIMVLCVGKQSNFFLKEYTLLLLFLLAYFILSFYKCKVINQTKFLSAGTFILMLESFEQKALEKQKQQFLIRGRQPVTYATLTKPPTTPPPKKNQTHAFIFRRCKQGKVSDVLSLLKVYSQ